MSQLKWKWWVDMTPEDNFDDAEVAKKQLGLRHAIAAGYEWTREEERAGRWLGLLLAVVVFGVAIASFCASHPLYPSGTVIMPDGKVILPLDIDHENSGTR